MTEESQENGAAAQQVAPPGLKVLTQFVRDLSFENALAGANLQGDVQPEIEVGVSLDGKRREDGSFEVYLTPERRGENWVELPDDANNLYVREIFIDWEAEQPSTLWIERLDVELPSPVS